MQYPGAFAFNDFFLRYVAYHSTAAYFPTFLLDCESERLVAGEAPQSSICIFTWLAFQGRYTLGRPPMTVKTSCTIRCAKLERIKPQGQ